MYSLYCPIFILTFCYGGQLKKDCLFEIERLSNVDYNINCLPHCIVDFLKQIVVFYLPVILDWTLGRLDSFSENLVRCEK